MSQPSPISLRSLLLVPVLCFGLAFFFSQTTFIQQLGWQSLDLRTALRTRIQRPPDPRVAIVLYEDTSNAQTETGIGPWPTDRKWHGELMKLMFAAEPAVIAWDIIFDADGKTPEGDQSMAEIAQAVRDGGVAVLSAGVSSNDPSASVPDGQGPTRPFPRVKGDITKLLAGDDRAFLPFKALRYAAHFSMADSPPGSDGIRRKVPLIARIGKEVYPSVALQALLLYLKVNPEDVDIVLGEHIRFSTPERKWDIPVESDGTIWVNFRYLTEGGVTRAIPTYPYSDLLFGLNEKFVEEKKDAKVPDLKGRIVLIGQTVTGLADAGPTPLSSYSALTLYHANVINSILKDDYVHFISDWATWFGAFLGSLFLFWFCIRKNPWWLIFITVGLLFSHALLCTLLWLYWSVWLLWLGPTLGFASTGFCFVAVRFRQEMRAKERIKGMFGSYLSPELLSKMTAAGSSLEVKSERRPITILFSDLRDFTAWSEVTPEDQLISQLNEYLAAMVECIHQQGGTLHKFIGDAVMAAWGDLQSISPTEDAAKACTAALAMQKRLDELNVAWAAKGMHTLRMGIGLNHGIALVGNIGSPRKLEFTVIGDPVNLASRLESLNKQMKTSTLAGESVRNLVADRFNFRPLGDVPVKGKAEPVAIFELIRTS